MGYNMDQKSKNNAVANSGLKTILDVASRQLSAASWKKMKTVSLIFGTRPEAIKLAPVYLALAHYPSLFRPQIWLTGQHRQMMDQVMDIFKLPAHCDFDLMQPGQTLTHVTSSVLSALEKAFNEERPDAIIVQGDTTTVFAASLAAFYAGIPVAHVEAGLRTNNKRSPYPEELNRRLTSQLSDFHFAPTEWSAANLRSEGTDPAKIWVTGNTVIDALDVVIREVRRSPPSLPADYHSQAIQNSERLVLITGHRRENFGAGFEQLCKAIRQLSLRYPRVAFLYPVHLNPKVREPVFRILGSLPNVFLIEPLDYRVFVWTMDRSFLILTDSGGVQEEVPRLGKPVLVMRDTTERPEVVEAGVAKLVGTDTDRIIHETTRLLEDSAAYRLMSQARNPYGDGHAAERIAKILAKVI